MSDVTAEDFKALVESNEDLRGQVAALTAVVGAMATAQGIKYDYLAECIRLSAKQVRSSLRPLPQQNASHILEYIEGMKRAFQNKNVLTFERPASKQR